MAEKTPLLKVEHLSKDFPAESGVFAKRFARKVSAVNDVSFEIYPGETLGLVGRVGAAGKSTTGRTIMRLTNPTAGKVYFEGKGRCRHEQARAQRDAPQHAVHLPGSVCEPEPRA